MATSISNILIAAFPKTQQEATTTFRSNHLNFQPPPIIICSQTRKPTFTCNSLSNTKSSLSSTITDLKQQKPESSEGNNEAAIAEVWRKIHGEDNWVGLLDPMDSLMRKELIRYGEMAQACYDAFDYDPYSKYCGGCKYPLHQFFESLEMTNPGYNLTRYLYATANVNLPNFFKKSRWPDKLWSQHANWAGYIAVSDDATTKRIGRRDIVVSWRGTVTHVEWVADLMNFLKPVSPFIPCRDENVKVEAGFLDLYTDKEKTCGYCKYSAKEQVVYLIHS